MSVTVDLDSFVGRKFKGHRVQKLGSMVEYLKHGQTIPKGTLVVMASGDARLRLKILDKDTPHKGFSTPLILKDVAKEKGITPEYLMWYLGQEEVAYELMRHAGGSVILRVPRAIIESIPIPVPRKPREWPVQEGEIILRKEMDEFKTLIGMFYEDFRLNVQHRRYRTAVILAGAICEAMLFQLLLEYGVEKKLLEEDRQLALGRLIKYVRLLRLDKEFGVPINHIQEIQKKRNVAVHIGASKGAKSSFTGDDLKDFDHIVKYFGL